MDVSSIPQSKEVIVQKKEAESKEAVAKELMDSVDKADDSAKQSREDRDTGRSVNIEA